MVAAPCAMVVTRIGAVEAPAATVIDAGTVATAGLLLESAIVAPPDAAAAVSVTVPCTVAPATTLVALNVMAETVGIVVGAVDEFEPHAFPAAVPTSTPARLAKPGPHS